MPATIDIISVKEEMRIGDRLAPEPLRQLKATRRVNRRPMDGHMVSVYGGR